VNCPLTPRAKEREWEWIRENGLREGPPPCGF
jgi:hypothetical protein